MANGENARLLNTIAGAVAGALVSNPQVPISRVDAPVVAEVVQNVIATDPVVKNELNQEAPIQSRVGWGSTIAGIGAAGSSLLTFAVLMGYITAEDSAQITAAASAAVGALGAVYSLYGRFAPGLKPLFSKK